MKCPRCGSRDIRLKGYLGIEIIKCNNCGFDEGSLYDAVAQEKASQKAKGSYSPYKTGGKQRSIKR